MDPVKRRRAEVVRRLIRAGWNPPVPTDVQADRILDDIATIGRDARRPLGLALSPREAQVLALIAQGKQSPEIAEELGIATATAIIFQRKIRRKLGAKTNAHAVALARRAA